MEFSSVAFGLPRYTIPTPILKRIIGEGAFINTAVELLDYILKAPAYNSSFLPDLCNALTVNEIEDLIREADETALKDLAVDGREAFLGTVLRVSQERRESTDKSLAKTIDSVTEVLTSPHMEEVLRRTLGLARPTLTSTTTYGHSPFHIALGQAHRVSPEQAQSWIHALTTQAIDYFLHCDGEEDPRDLNWALPKVTPMDPMVWPGELLRQRSILAIDSNAEQDLEAAAKTGKKPNTSLLPRPKGRKSSSNPSQKSRVIGDLLASKSPAKKRASKGVGSGGSTSRTTRSEPAANVVDRRKSSRF